MKYWGADENDVDKLVGRRAILRMYLLGSSKEENMQNGRNARKEGRGWGLYALETTAVDHLNIAQGTSK